MIVIVGLESRKNKQSNSINNQWKCQGAICLSVSLLLLYREMQGFIIIKLHNLICLYRFLGT